ncbi:MAG: hypothetical protein JWR09_5411 [Mucilaginibacter sp.]|nr:hypothetical protein [Mucilaginibacter sp.]
MQLFTLLTTCGFILVIALNVGIYFLIIKRAIRKYVIPDLTRNALDYISYKALGIFQSGDFEGKEKRTFSPIVSKNGSPAADVYFYIFYKSGIEQKRVTVKVETLFFVIRKVKYSKEL